MPSQPKPLPSPWRAAVALTRRSNSQCAYRVNGNPESPETLLFTRDGRDILRFAIRWGSSHQRLWAYFHVASYGPQGFAVEASRATPVVIPTGYDKPGPIGIAVAWAKDITIR